MSQTRPSPEEAEAVAGDDSLDDIPARNEAGFPDAEESVTIDIFTLEYTTRKQPSGREAPVIEVFGRTPENEFEHVRVYGFDPYFYVPLEIAEDRDLVDEYHEVIEVKTEDEDGDPFLSIREERCAKVITQTPRGVPIVRDDFEQHYESDVLFTNRFLVDKDIGSGISVPARRTDDGTIRVPEEEVEPVQGVIQGAQQRILMLDIEVEDRNGFPENGEEPLISITTYDNYSDKYVVWYYDAEDGEEGPEEIPDYEPMSEDVDIQIAKLKNEEHMVRAFVAYFNEVDPTIVTGWNFDDFDAPYLIDRMNRIGIDPNNLSRIGETKNDWDAEIGGRIVFDLLYGYKRTQFTELESYRLDAVGERELGVGKETYTGDIGSLWEDDPETLLEYNLRDVELCVEIDRKQNIIPFWEEVQNFIGCSLTDAPTPGDACDMYVLHKIGDRYVLPSKEYSDKEEFEGGAVFDPITGVLDDVVVQDLKSLYPMSMCTINASPETKVENPEEYDGETLVAPNGIHFEKDSEGVLQEMIDDLLDEREDKKALRNENEPGTDEYVLYDRQQAAVKVIMNSLYGVLSWPKFRLYDKEIGAATTATGREVIKFTEVVVEELGYEIAYGDTDSVMYQIPDKSGKEELIEAALEHEEYINDRYSDFAKERLNADDHRFQIEFEKLYKRFFQAGKKKRYAGHIIYKEGKDVDKIDITGFEFERSDQSAITKRVQKKVIKQIVTGADHDEIIDYVQGVVEDFKNEDIPLEDIGMPGGIGKALDDYDTATAQVRGAIYANIFLGTNFRQGSKPKRVYLEDVDTKFIMDFEKPDDLEPYEEKHYSEFRKDPDVICYEYEEQVPEEFHVDLDKMLEKTLEKPIGRVIEPIGIDWDTVTLSTDQTGLEHFMN